MRFYLLFFLTLCSFHAYADRDLSSSIPKETINRLKRIYPQQSEAFIIERLMLADSAFSKWRGFPPYYYQLLKRMKLSLKKKVLGQRQGLCAGDAHLENFGFLYLKESLFTLNDLDDVASCSLNADLMRLFIGFQFLDSIDVKSFLLSYQKGFKGENLSLPHFLEKLKKKSQKKKKDLSKKYSALYESKVCEGEFSSVNEDELALIKDFTLKEEKEFLKACARVKEVGGSAGIKRFVVFYQTKKKKIRAFELKPLVQQAPLFQNRFNPKKREETFKKSIEVFFDPKASEEYYPVNLKEVLYQRRPVWAGNEGVKLDDLGQEDLKEVMLYEAWTLGRIHSRSNKEELIVPIEHWESLAKEIKTQWEKEMGE